MNYYKYAEIEEHFSDFLAEQSAEWIESHKDDIYNHAFNTDYYIIGTWKAEQWLGSSAFEIIRIISDYEKSAFGEVYTD